MWICARCTHSNAADNFRCGGNSLAGCGSVNPHLHPGGAPSLEPAGSFNAVPQFQILDGSPNTNGGSGSSSIDNSSDSRRNANGWDCPKCGNHNFAARTVCNMRHCKMPRPGVAADAAAPPGSWQCTGCGNINWPMRTTCNRRTCGRAKNFDCATSGSMDSLPFHQPPISLNADGQMPPTAAHALYEKSPSGVKTPNVHMPPFVQQHQPLQLLQFVDSLAPRQYQEHKLSQEQHVQQSMQVHLQQMKSQEIQIQQQIQQEQQQKQQQQRQELQHRQPQQQLERQVAVRAPQPQPQVPFETHSRESHENPPSWSMWTNRWGALEESVQEDVATGADSDQQLVHPLQPPSTPLQHEPVSQRLPFSSAGAFVASLGGTSPFGATEPFTGAGLGSTSLPAFSGAEPNGGVSEFSVGSNVQGNGHGLRAPYDANVNASTDFLHPSSSHGHHQELPLPWQQHQAPAAMATETAPGSLFPASAPFGSWICTGCGNVNWPMRTVCNRRSCGKARTQDAIIKP